MQALKPESWFIYESDFKRNFNGMNYQKKYWNGSHQGEGNEEDLNLPGRRGLEEWWEKRS
jgi:hypothetical protein